VPRATVVAFVRPAGARTVPVSVTAWSFVSTLILLSFKRASSTKRVAAPTLLISAADDLYRTLPVARHAATVIPHSRLIELATGGHLLLGRGEEVWPTVAAFLRCEARSAAA
jgi:pimeloyl-ACP methyl ester carboxylesterase